MTNVEYSTKIIYSNMATIELASYYSILGHIITYTNKTILKIQIIFEQIALLLM